MKKELFKATLLLSVGGLICKALGAFYRIPLSNILGAEGMGVYQLIFPLYSFALVLVSGALPLAISKFTAKSLVKKQYNKIGSYFLWSIFISLVVGVFFALIFSVFAKQIASLQGVYDAYIGYYAIGIGIIFACLISCFRGVFQGFSNMYPTFYSNLFEQVFKLILGLLLACLLSTKGVYWSVFGALIAISIAEVLTFAFILIQFLISKKKRKIILNFNFKDKKESFENAKELIKFSFPITLSSLLIPSAFAFQSIVCVNLLVKFGHSNSYATSLFGIQSGMINSIINFPTIISAALAITLVPSITFYLSQKNTLKVKNLISQVYQIIWTLIIPCTFGLIAFSSEIISFVFANALNDSTISIASSLLKISSLSILFATFSQITTVILQSLEKQWKAFISLMIFLFCNIFLTILLILKFSILGLALANLFSYSISSIINLVFLSKLFSPHLSLKVLLLPILISLFMAILSKLIYNFLPINFIIFKLILSIIFAIIFYFFFLFLFKIFNFKLFFNKEKNHKISSS